MPILLERVIDVRSRPFPLNISRKDRDCVNHGGRFQSPSITGQLLRNGTDVFAETSQNPRISCKFVTRSIFCRAGPIHQAFIGSLCNIVGKELPHQQKTRLFVKTNLFR